MNTFFAEWYKGDGFPSYQLVLEQKNNLFSFDLLQRTSDPSVPFFHLPLPVYLHGETSDTVLFVEAISPFQIFTFSVAFKVLNVEIDPERQLISASNKAFRKDELTGDVIRVYPNPFFETLSFFSTRADVLFKTIVIYDIGGRKLLEVALNQTNSGEIIVPPLGPGVYFIDLITEKGVFQKSLIKTSNPR